MSEQQAPTPRKPEIMDGLAVFQMLRKQVGEAGSQRAWCEQNGIGESVLSAALNAHRKPSPAILRALGLVEVVRYVPDSRRTKP